MCIRDRFRFFQDRGSLFRIIQDWIFPFRFLRFWFRRSGLLQDGVLLSLIHIFGIDGSAYVVGPGHMGEKEGE